MTETAGAQTPSLLDIYLALSHVTQARGPLAPLAGEAHEETPCLHVAHLMTGEWRVSIRADLPAETRERLAALPPETLASDHARVAGILARGAPSGAAPGTFSAGLWIGRTLLFPDDLASILARRPLDGIVRLAPQRAGDDCYGEPAPPADRWRPAIAPADEPPPAPDIFPAEQVAALADGLVVATCESARESALAAEAWVRTLPAARRRGYATRVTAAWALDARRRGKTPFYSYSRENVASAGVAHALQLIPFLDDVGYL